ncbi:MAG: MerR family transcriptional regulator [Acidimicrobiia bacterium]|nr:MerR family transcriptional regulator [Acidimicrobiia bacterium]
MTFRVEELASETGLSVDTIRYYQGLGLIEAPEREGRTARYTEDHRRQIETVRRLAASGFTLAQIQRLTSDEGAPLLKALVGQTVGIRTLSMSELSESSGVPEPLIGVAVTAGLLDSIGIDDEPRFSEDAIPMLSAAASLLDAGIPLQLLTDLAVRHAQNVTSVVEGAIELFRDHVRPAQGDDTGDLTELFQVLLSQATRLVAQHFQQTLVSRALERLRDSDDRALVEALLAAEAQRFVVSCEWR